MNRLLRLPERPAPTFRFHGRTPPKAEQRTPIVAEKPSTADEDGVAVLRLYDPIDSWGDYWGVSAKEFQAALDTVDAEKIHLHINSPGGEVWEGVAILNQLRAHKAHVTAIVDGIAASAASFIACGADETVMAKNSQMMIHDASGICIGQAGDMHGFGDLLDKISDNIAGIYADKSGGTVPSWREAMLAESWYNADEAVTAGLADRVDGAEPVTDSFDLSAFTYQGRDTAPPPRAGAESPSRQANLSAYRHRLVAAKHRLTV